MTKIYKMEVEGRDLIGRIGKLSKKEKLHILNILKTHKIEFTKNANGYFFNLNDIDNIVAGKIVRCLELIEKNRDLISEMDKRRDEMLDYYKALIEEKYELSKKKRRIEYIKRITLKESCVNISFTKKQLYKSKRYMQEDIDPDDLIEDYIKAAKAQYKKGTAFFRIAAIMRYKRGKGNKSGGLANDHYEEDESVNDNVDYEDSDIQSIVDSSGTVVEEDANEDDGEVDGDDFEEEPLEHEADEADEGHEEVDIAKDEVDDCDQSDNKFQMEYYKSILKNKGYDFNTGNKELVYQEYINAI